MVLQKRAQAESSDPVLDTESSKTKRAKIFSNMKQPWQNKDRQEMAYCVDDLGPTELRECFKILDKIVKIQDPSQRATPAMAESFLESVFYDFNDTQINKISDSDVSDCGASSPSEQVAMIITDSGPIKLFFHHNLELQSLTLTINLVDRRLEGIDWLTSPQVVWFSKVTVQDQVSQSLSATLEAACERINEFNSDRAIKYARVYLSFRNNGLPMEGFVAKCAFMDPHISMLMSTHSGVDYDPFSGFFGEESESQHEVDE